MKRMDANLGLGTVKAPFSGSVATTAEDVLALMDSVGVERALVWHAAQAIAHASVGNSLLAAVLQGQPRLVGCWTLLPSHTGETTLDELAEVLSRPEFGAVRLFPVDHRYPARREVLGPLLDLAVARRIPVLLSLKHGFDWASCYDLLSDFPEMTAVLCDVGIWGQTRNFWPLLDRYEQVYVETSLVSLQAGGLEAGVQRFGAGRFLFGSGYPGQYVEASLCELMAADLTAVERQAIAHENLEGLLGGGRP